MSEMLFLRYLNQRFVNRLWGGIFAVMSILYLALAHGSQQRDGFANVLADLIALLLSVFVLRLIDDFQSREIDRFIVPRRVLIDTPAWHVALWIIVLFFVIALLSGKIAILTAIALAIACWVFNRVEYFSRNRLIFSGLRQLKYPVLLQFSSLPMSQLSFQDISILTVVAAGAVGFEFVDDPVVKTNSLVFRSGVLVFLTSLYLLFLITFF